MLFERLLIFFFCFQLFGNNIEDQHLHQLCSFIRLEKHRFLILHPLFRPFRVFEVGTIAQRCPSRDGRLLRHLKLYLRGYLDHFRFLEDNTPVLAPNLLCISLIRKKEFTKSSKSPLRYLAQPNKV